MKVLDLFAGIGGFSLAAHRMGWQTVAFVEWDKFCQKVLNKNFPGVPVYGDIREFDGTKYRGQVDIITGGFPCQPFSQAGKQKGKNDDRYLFPEMLRVIEEVNPRWIVAENVRGLLSIQNGEVFSEICSQLESKGYTVWTFGVPASAVEAPHERMRLWIICSLSNPSSERSFPGTHAGIHSGKESVGARNDEPERSDCQLTNTLNTRLQGDELSGTPCEGTGASRSTPERTWDENWLEAATRLCGVDARFSDELDVVGARDNRVNRLKALGNSIVPQIAYEIFISIEAAQ